MHKRRYSVPDDGHEGDIIVGCRYALLCMLPTLVAIGWALYIVFFYHR